MKHVCPEVWCYSRIPHDIKQDGQGRVKCEACKLDPAGYHSDPKKVTDEFCDGYATATTAVVAISQLSRLQSVPIV